jgi:hypothetical protein
MTPESVEVTAGIAVVHTDVPEVSEQADVVLGAAAVPVEANQRRRLFAELPLVSVIGGVALGLVIIALHHFRWGNVVIAGSLLVGALFRAVLPTRQAGLLVVRARFTDVVTMVAMGGALMVLALVTRT